MAQTIGANAGSGGNNVSIVISEPETYAIAATAVDRQPHNGGNGLGIQRDVSPTLTRTDIHCVYTQQRSDEYSESGVASTQAARQYKDSTDLVCQQTVYGQAQYGAYVSGYSTLRANGGDNGGGSESLVVGELRDEYPIRIGNLVRRLTPLECERLMGFPDCWTCIPGASDSKRYRGLGNSVAVPCVEYIMMGIAAVYAEEGEQS